VARITSIKQQKDENRVNVYLDGKFGFGIDLDNFVKLGLRVEQEIDEKKLKEVVAKSEHQKILDRLINFVIFRPRSIEEIKIWLRRKKIPEDMHESLWATLKRLGFVDDYKFAQWWLEQRASFRPKAKKALKYELLKKGVDRKIIDQVLEEAPVDEEKIAMNLLDKRKSKWEKMDKKEVKQKMYAYLAARGFDWELVKSVVEKFISSFEEF
jgi:regulatory protein